MAAFKLKPGNGEEVENFGLTFRADRGTEVEDADIVERLRKHFMFDEVMNAAPVVSRETIDAAHEVADTAKNPWVLSERDHVVLTFDDDMPAMPDDLEPDTHKWIAVEADKMPVAKRRGRPPGSKNKSQTDEG